MMFSTFVLFDQSFDNLASSQTTHTDEDTSPFIPEGDERALQVEDFDAFLDSFRKRYTP